MTAKVWPVGEHSEGGEVDLVMVEGRRERKGGGRERKIERGREGRKA